MLKTITRQELADEFLAMVAEGKEALRIISSRAKAWGCSRVLLAEMLMKQGVLLPEYEGVRACAERMEVESITVDTENRVSVTNISGDVYRCRKDFGGVPKKFSEEDGGIARIIDRYDEYQRGCEATVSDHAEETGEEETETVADDADDEREDGADEREDCSDAGCEDASDDDSAETLRRASDYIRAEKGIALALSFTKRKMEEEIEERERELARLRESFRDIEIAMRLQIEMARK